MNRNSIYKVMMWNIIGTRSQLLRDTIAMAIAYTVMSLPTICFPAVFSNGFHTASVGIIIVSCYVLAKKASQVCFNMKTKSEFVTYAMLPATNAEKFVINVLYQTVLRFVMLLAALLVADAILALVCLVFCQSAMSLTMYVMDAAFSFLMLSDSFYPIILLLFVQSTFVLGGCFFRKHAMFSTVLLWIAFPFVLSAITGSLIYLALHVFDSLGYILYVDPLGGSHVALEICAKVFVVVVTVLDYWLSYRLFCRMQLINNKFFN